MSEDAITKAMDSLAIQRVYLRSCEIRSNDEFEVGFFEGRFENQLRHSPVKFMRLDGVDENGGSIKCVRYVIEFGWRVVSHDESQEATEPSPSNTAFETIARFNVDYSVKADVDDESLNAFLKNAVHNAWPYWREFVQSTCARAGIPVVEIPPFRLPKKN